MFSTKWLSVSLEASYGGWGDRASYAERKAGEFVLITDASLRKPILAAIDRAGVEPWPRLRHNLRANRQSELLDLQPFPLVCKWMGNSVEVAAKHYVFPLESDHEEVISEAAALISVQRAAQTP